MSSQDQPGPSRLFLHFFRWFCDPNMVDDIEGDLLERFEIRTRKKGLRKARGLFIRDVLQLFRPGIIRNFKRTQKLNRYDMFKNYFKVAYRNLWRHKSHSLINISGLAVGVAATLLMLLYVNHETSYDQFHENAERIYRVGLHGKMQDSEFHQVYTTAQLASAMTENFPEVETAVRLQKVGNITLQLLEDSVAIKSYLENKGYWTDASIFEVFSINLLIGDGEKALSDINQILLAQSTAERYFGPDWRDQDILKRTLTTNFGRGQVTVQVAGVVEDLPGTSHFHFDFLMSNENVASSKSTNWWNNGYFTYLRLAEDASPEALEAKLPQLYEQNLPARAFSDGNEWWSFLQPLTDIHLHSNISGELEANGNISYVYIFLVTATLILIMACVNFINLTVARAATRFKEVGIRKVVGSARSQLILQQLVDSQLFCLISVLLALGIVIATLPSFQSFAQISQGLEQFNPYLLAIGVLLFSFLLGSVSGLYPALYLTRTAPARAVKGAGSTAGRKNWFKNALMTFQFVISIGIISGSFIISQQLDFMQNKSLGFEKEGVLVLENAYFLNTSMETFKTELGANAGILESAASLSVPTRRFANVQFRPQDRENMVMDFIFADGDFLDTYDIEVKEGRYFSEQFAADSSTMIINESLAKNLGWEEPIGKKIFLFGSDDLAFTIVGVMEDFHHKSLHHEKEPMAILPNFSPSSFGNLYVSMKINGSNIRATLDHVEATWNEFSNAPISYFFLDDYYDSLYKGETQTKTVFRLFSGLTAFIAIVGLIGLVAHNTQLRLKEIGIRKVLGASVFQLIGMLSRRFVMVIIASFAIMLPLVWFMMERWLENFSYSIGIPWPVFLLAGGAVLVVSFLIIAFQSLKTLLINPSTILRAE